ncbi:MAG TPA: SMP-30/gluconolactonase/LRE family protein, partial [Nitrospirales bacterium]|nr:SMP-30/gluconolactonase/LRE family protein [Nitrospirales bacterium]
MTKLLDVLFYGNPLYRKIVTVESGVEDWGAGQNEDANIPQAPANLRAIPDHTRITLTWDPVPEALYYNVYFMTTKGVQIKPNELTRPVAGQEDFIPKVGITKEKANCIEGAISPYEHNDLANNFCYHYAISVVTEEGESLLSEEIMSIPSPYLPVMQIGCEGVDDGEFKSPTGIAIDKDGNIYVGDTDNHSIQKFDRSGKFLARWGDEPDSTEGKFYYPRGIATSPEGDVYVADSGNNRIQKFDSEGNIINAWGKFGFAWRGAEAGKFDVPWGVTTDSQGNLFVSDTSNARIQKFLSDGSPVLKWGRDGGYDGAFFYPRGLAVDFVGNIYIADEGNHRIQKFDARGNFLLKWGKEGNAPGQFKAPWGVACDPLGYVYVVDSGNHRVQKFDSSGTYLTSWGNRGLTEGQLNFPSGIAVDKEGYVYVIDSGNHRLTKFAPTEDELNRGKQEKRVASDLTAPINLAVKPGDTENILSWLEVPNAVSYNLYFSTEPNLSTDTSTKIEGVTTPYIHSGLTNNTAYFYAMTSVTEDGAESRLSEEQTAIPVLIDISAPQNPDIVINHGAYMTNSPDMVATISAKDVDSGVAAYFISENPMTPSG